MNQATQPAATRPDIVDFEAIGRLPLPGDNAAIATRDLPAGLRFSHRGQVHRISHAILEGHRFATEPIGAGEDLLSWNLTFGRALRPIAPGEYLCNAAMLDVLRLRRPDLPAPPVANFQNAVAQFKLDEVAYRPGRQVSLHPDPATFLGYPRSGGRGAGTRNVIVVLGTSSSTGSFARQLAGRLKAEVRTLSNIDGIEAVAHTEGSGASRPNNLEFLLRTLAGFVINPNVAAVLCVDVAGDYVDNARLKEYLDANRYPADHVLHAFYTLSHDIGKSLDECAAIVRGWYDEANAAERRPCPLAELKIGLQCGGSDAFSGVSGNPLAGWVAREVIRHGGAAGLAETDELMGAESWMLANTKSLDVSRRFLEKLAIFRERIGWHGHSAEGNPTGGNLFRGLYNISLKSIGAARKKDPDVRLDHVIDYAERMEHPGFYFMDSPGNDLESIAGQVASGCNLIFFITGNGSITNFPFVPTIKFLTTTRRWNLLAKDMDVNAGRYQDGEKLEDIGMETFEYAVKVASGMRSVGERAGHSQVSIWRDWCQTDGSQLERLRRIKAPDGKPLTVRTSRNTQIPTLGLPPRPERVGLILPTSLCSGQIALRIAGELNARLPHGLGGMPNGKSGRDQQRGLSRFVALPHTEGCGVSGGENQDHYMRTMVGHLLHPMVGAALLLEHGCEHTHNDLMRYTLKQYGIDPQRFGYASIQLDGGIDSVMTKVIAWFAECADRDDTVARGGVPLSLGLTADGAVLPSAAAVLADLAAATVGAGGRVVVPRSASLIGSEAFVERLGLKPPVPDTLAYAQVAEAPGLHVMATPTRNFVEALTGLGGTGVHAILAHVTGAPRQGHPMIPTLQIATAGAGTDEFAADLDDVIGAAEWDTALIRDRLIGRLGDTLSRDYVPRCWSRGFIDFQVTRGLLGVSL